MLATSINPTARASNRFELAFARSSHSKNTFKYVYPAERSSLLSNAWSFRVFLTLGAQSQTTPYFDRYSNSTCPTSTPTYHRYFLFGTPKLHARRN